MCADLREETWPFSFQLLLLNKVNQIAQNSRQPEFNVEEKGGKIPCLPKEPLKNLQGRLCFQTLL